MERRRVRHLNSWITYSLKRTGNDAEDLLVLLALPALLGLLVLLGLPALIALLSLLAIPALLPILVLLLFLVLFELLESLTLRA